VEAQGAFLMHADNRRGILAMSLAMALFIKKKQKVTDLK